MLFNSLQFLFFFIIVTSIYFVLAHKYRWVWLLAASCYFYMAFVPIYILILGFTIVIDYFAGRWIENAVGKKRKIYLIISLTANIGVLAIFKYYNFINENLTILLHGVDASNSLPYLSILLPIGLSFHTFQAMSYTIEVYRGNQKAERHFGIYSLYVMFYPQLVAGPIERPQNLLHQFREKHNFDYDRITSGLKLMVWGLFKKAVIADRLSILVDTVFNNPQENQSLSILIATVFFSFQIFCDFSGYSDMAIGAARVMGFKLMTNFNQPYQSKTISEFWKRWHISLSTWFKDYLYIPLGGNKVRVPRWYFNLFIVFIISGLWHGANWTFIVWGALHGFYLVFALITRDIREKLSKLFYLNSSFLLVCTTFILVAFAWIFFRAKNLSDARYIIGHLFSDGSKMLSIPSIKKIAHLGLNKYELLIAICSLFLMAFVHYLQRKERLGFVFYHRSVYLRWGLYYMIVLSIITFGVFKKNQFIYFQF
jgi:alginate O-acetyltransferase complex protein AlgI